MSAAALGAQLLRPSVRRDLRRHVEGKTRTNEAARPVTPRLIAIEQGLMLVVFAAVSVAMTWPLAADVRTQVADVGVGDQLFYARMVRHFLAWASGARSGLFDIDYYWPHPNVLATTDAALGIFYSSIPFLPFTRDPMMLVNLGIILSFVLTAHATWLLARELTGSNLGAIIAGVGFSFCAYRFHQLDHLNVLQMQWLGYALFALLKLAQKPTLVRAALFAVATGLYATGSINLALYASPLFGAALILSVAMTPRESRPRVALLVAGALAVGALLALPVYLPYLEAKAAHDLHWTQWYFDQYSGRIEQLTAVPRFNRMYGQTRGYLLGPESITFAGYGLLVLAFVGLALGALDWRTKQRPILPGLVLAAVAIGWTNAAITKPNVGLLLLGLVLVLVVMLLRAKRPDFNDSAWKWTLFALALFGLLAAFGPIVRERQQTVAEGIWVMLAKLPGFNSVRTPARLFFLTQYCVALLAAFGVAAVAERWKSKRVEGAVAALALLVVVAESWSAPIPTRRVPTLEQAPATHKWIAQQPGKGGVVELPIHEPVERERMFVSLVHDRPILNGEAGFQLPLLKSLMHNALVQGTGVDNLRKLRAAGLEFAILDYGIAANAANAYAQLISAAGGTKVAEFSEGAVFKFEPVQSKPLASTVVSAAVRLRSSPEGRVAEVSFTASDWVFDFDTKKLRLELDGGRVRRDVYLSPPLFAPGTSTVKSVELKADLTSSEYKLVGPDGAVWSSGTVTL